MTKKGIIQDDLKKCRAYLFFLKYFAKSEKTPPHSTYRKFFCNFVENFE